MGNVKGKNREELTRINLLERLPKEDPIYVIDLFVNKLVENDPKTYEWKEYKNNGRNSYTGKVLLKIILYCYLNKITGSRPMAEENKMNIKMIWLTEDIQPEHKTIAEYIREKREAISEMVKEFRRFLKEFKYIDGKEVIIDGTKEKADAGKKIYSISKLENKLKSLGEKEEEYLKECEEIDKLDESIENKTEKLKELNKKEEELKESIKYFEQIKKETEEIVLKKENKITNDIKKKQVCLNESEANLMKMKNNFNMAYNVQIVMDNKHKFIIVNEVTDEGNDIGSLYRTIKKTEEEIDLKVENVLADSGYNNIVDIRKLESENKKVYVQPKKETRNNIFIVYDENDKKELKLINEKISKINPEKKLIEIVYNKEEDNYKCENNKIFVKTTQIREERLQFYYIYKCKDCKGCKLKSRCTSAKSNKRELYISTLKDEIKEFKEKMKTDKSQLMLLKRKYIEHINANLKAVFGRKGFSFVGIKQVQNFVNLCELTYNIKHLCNIENQDIILQQLDIYFNSKKVAN